LVRLSTFLLLKRGHCPTWWHTCIIPAIRRLKQEDPQFKASLSYMRPCLKITKGKQNKTLDAMN
jgi:hypothetical protein